MENNEDLKHLLKQLRSQALSLADPETLNKFKLAKEKRKKTKEAEEAYLQTQKEENDKLQKDLDELHQQRKELEAQLVLREEAASQREELCRVAQQKVEELEREHKSLFEEVEVIKESIENHDGTVGDLLAVQRKPKQLQLALYQGLGVAIKLDKHDRATAACLRSLNDQELRLIPINENEPLLSTTNRIWEFIS